MPANETTTTINFISTTTNIYSKYCYKFQAKIHNSN